jgi:hypothetical protein
VAALGSVDTTYLNLSRHTHTTTDACHERRRVGGARGSISANVFSCRSSGSAMRFWSNTGGYGSVASLDPSANAPRPPLLASESHSQLEQAAPQGLASEGPSAASGLAGAEFVGPPRLVHQRESRGVEGLSCGPQSLLGFGKERRVGGSAVAAGKEEAV